MRDTWIAKSGLPRLRSRPPPHLLAALLLPLLLALLFLAANPTTGALTGSPIRVGVFQCNAPTRLACFVPRIDALQSMWFDSVASKGILGRPVEKVSAWISGSTLATEDEMATATADLLHQGVDFVVWPIASNTPAKGMALLDAAKVPSVAGGTVFSSVFRCDSHSWCNVGCECPDGVKPPDYQRRRRFEYTHSPSNVDESYMREWVALLRLKKALTIAIVRVDNIFFQSIVTAMQQQARDYRMELIYSALAPFTSTTDSSVSFDTALRIISEIAELEPDGVALLAFDCTVWLDAMRQIAYTPPSLMAANCIDNSVAASNVERNFVSGPAQWDARLDSSEYTETLGDPWAMFGINTTAARRDLDADAALSAVPVTSTGLFTQLWQHVYNSTEVPGYTYAEYLASFSMLHAAVVLANSTDGPLVNAQLTEMAQPSFYGLIETNQYGYNQHKPMLIIQQDLAGKVQIVAPIQYATADFVYPAPEWHERVYTQRLFALSVERVFLGLVVACAVVTLLLLVLVLMRWDHPLLRATGPMSYVAVVVGCMCGYTAVLCWTIENTTAQCAARVWLVSIAFHCVLQPLLFALRKVHRIHSASRSLRSPSAKAAQNRLVFLLRILAILPPVVFNFGSGVPAMQPKYEDGSDPLRPGTSAYTLCEPTNHAQFKVAIALHCTYGGLLLLLTCVYAVRIRRLPPVYHDANALAYAVYLLALSVLCIGITQSVLGDGGSERSVAILSFALRSSGMLLGYLSVVVLVIGSRVQLPRISVQGFLSNTSPSQRQRQHELQRRQMQQRQQLQLQLPPPVMDYGAQTFGIGAAVSSVNTVSSPGAKVGAMSAVAGTASMLASLGGPIHGRFVYPGAVSAHQSHTAPQSHTIGGLAIATPILMQRQIGKRGTPVLGDRSVILRPAALEMPPGARREAIGSFPLSPVDSSLASEGTAGSSEAESIGRLLLQPQPAAAATAPYAQAGVPAPQQQAASTRPTFVVDTLPFSGPPSPSGEKQESSCSSIPVLAAAAAAAAAAAPDPSSAAAAAAEVGSLPAIYGEVSHLWDPPPTPNGSVIDGAFHSHP